MSDKKKGILNIDLGFGEPFEALGKEVAPNERALSGELGDDMLDLALGKKHVKRLKGYVPTHKKGLLDL